MAANTDPTDDEYIAKMEEHAVGKRIETRGGTVYEIDSCRVYNGPELRLVPLDHNGDLVTTNYEWISLKRFQKNVQGGTWKAVEETH